MANFRQYTIAFIKYIAFANLRGYAIVLSISVLAISLCISFAITKAQEPPITIHLETDATELAVGSEFEVRLIVNSLVEVYAGTIALSYNPNVLEAVAFQNGDFFAEGGQELDHTIDNTAGTLKFGYSQIGSTPQISGEGVFLTIQFRTLREDSADIELRSAEFAQLIMNEDNLPSDAQQFTDIPAQILSLTVLGDELIDLPEVEEATPIYQNPIMIGLILLAAVVLVGLLVVVFQLMRPQPVHAELILDTERSQLTPEQLEALPNKIQLRKNRSLFGRATDNGAELTLPFQGVSMRHAVISRTAPGQYFIRDWESTYGTYVSPLGGSEKEKVKQKDAYRLKTGTLVYFTEKIAYLFVIKDDLTDMGNTHLTMMNSRTMMQSDILQQDDSLQDKPTKEG